MAEKPKCPTPKCKGVMVKIKNEWVCCRCKHVIKAWKRGEKDGR